MSLLSIYDGLINAEDLASKIIVIYLIYRVRDLESALRRKGINGGIDDVLGHPFLPFFLSLISSKCVEEPCIQSAPVSAIEKSIALYILCGKVSDFATSTAIELATSEPLNTEGLTGVEDVESFYKKQSARWPQYLDISSIPQLLPDHVCKKFPSTQEMFTDVIADRLCHEIPPVLSLSLANILPAFHPIQDMELPESLRSVVQAERELVASECEQYIPPESLKPHRAGPSGFKPQSISPTGDLCIASSTSSIAATVEKMETYTKRLLEGNMLSPSEVRLAVKYLINARMDDILLMKLVGMSDREIPKFIECNVKIDSFFPVATEVIFKAVVGNKELIFRYMRIMLGMEVSVQCLEIIIRVYMNIPDLSTQPLNEYVRYCIRSCQDRDLSGFQQIRLVRLVCLLLSSLIKERILKVKDVFIELHQFVLKFTQHRETTALYQAVLEAQARENRDL
uniref:CCR4-NOT transcription complex subunit 11 n=1 Tax=Heterorhabditis bacteriophora TaxID=37862 RepID=A0A1I7XSA2_HETBA